MEDGIEIEKGYREKVRHLREKYECIGDKQDAEKKYILDLKKNFRPIEAKNYFTKKRLPTRVSSNFKDILRSILMNRRRIRYHDVSIMYSCYDAPLLLQMYFYNISFQISISSQIILE